MEEKEKDVQGTVQSQPEQMPSVVRYVVNINNPEHVEAFLRLSAVDQKRFDEELKNMYDYICVNLYNGAIMWVIDKEGNFLYSNDDTDDIVVLNITDLNIDMLIAGSEQQPIPESENVDEKENKEVKPEKE